MKKKKYAHTAKHPKKVIFFAFEASSKYLHIIATSWNDGLFFVRVFTPITTYV